MNGQLAISWIGLFTCSSWECCCWSHYDIKIVSLCHFPKTPEWSWQQELLPSVLQTPILSWAYRGFSRCEIWIFPLPNVNICFVWFVSVKGREKNKFSRAPQSLYIFVLYQQNGKSPVEMAAFKNSLPTFLKWKQEQGIWSAVLRWERAIYWGLRPKINPPRRGTSLWPWAITTSQINCFVSCCILWPLSGVGADSVSQKQEESSWKRTPVALLVKMLTGSADPSSCVARGPAV